MRKKTASEQAETSKQIRERDIQTKRYRRVGGREYNGSQPGGRAPRKGSQEKLKRSQDSSVRKQVVVLKNVSAERHHSVPSNDDNDHPQKIQFVRIPNMS